jgi:acyl-CoA ligase (AMP-forming) (exosortase A-associated)
MGTGFNYGIAKHLQDSAARYPERVALVESSRRWTYAEFAAGGWRCAAALIGLGLPRFARVALYLDKCIENAVAVYAATAAGLIVVPINPKLKPAQVQHILRDCGASVLITTPFRLKELDAAFELGAVQCILTGAGEVQDVKVAAAPLLWKDWLEQAAVDAVLHRFIDSDPAAILYTSGSTGMPKGVVLSQRNLTAGAESVNAYFGTTEDDTLLALLPLSFDAGLSQLTMAVAKGARLVLHNYFRAQEVVKLCASEHISIIVGVPPMWSQLAAVPWQDNGASVRLFGNTGGHMNASLLASLRGIFRNATPYLMYGLTEAFRSTYLEPAQLEIRPSSVGKAMPNVELLLLREDGSVCGAGEEGELVHRGPLVTLGYWNDPGRTAERFRSLPSAVSGGLLAEMAVWSGDIFKQDEDGYLYFVGRRDEMIKSSGYRISPMEIETTLQAAPGVREVVVFPVPDEAMGQVPVAAIVAERPPLALQEVLNHCSRVLPSYMVPRLIEVAELPRSPNGKIDRVSVRAAHGQMPVAGAVQ